MTAVHLNTGIVRRGSGNGSGGDGGGGIMAMKMKGYGDTVACLAMNPKWTYLLSNSMDRTIKTWDFGPFVEDGGKRHCKNFVRGTNNEKGLLNCAWISDWEIVTGRGVLIRLCTSRTN